ncbi:hypothetical protein R6Q59_016371 [Mikania micrantha]
MEVGRLTPDWFRILVGDTIDYTEVRGWRKTGRPKQVNPSFTELKTIRCIIDGPELEDVYKIGEMSKLPVGDKTVAFTSSLLEEGMKTGTRSEYSDEAIEEDVYKIGEMSKLPVGDKTVAFTSSLLEEGMKTGTRSEYSDEAIEEDVYKIGEMSKLPVAIKLSHLHQACLRRE